MRQEKQLLLDEVKEKIDESSGFIVASYKDFNADRVREFRDLVSEAGGEFEVVRKRVFLKAAEASGITFEQADLKGHIGIVFAKEDATKLSKVSVKYGEDNGDAVEVRGGQIDGETCSAEDVLAIARLPSMDELRAQLLSLFEAPMSQTVAVFQAALTGVLHCLDQKAKKEN